MDEAIALYQRLIQEFPDREAEANLARKHLTTLGGEPPSPGSPTNLEQKEIQRLQQLAKTAPDILRQRETLIEAVKSGTLATVRFLLDHGADGNGQEVLANAAGSGFIEIAKLLIEHGGKPKMQQWSIAINYSISSRRNEMLAFLLGQGIAPDNAIQTDSGTLWLKQTIEANNKEATKMLIEHGADPNRILTVNGDKRTTLLMEAAEFNKVQKARQLLGYGADANFASPDGGVTPLHLSVSNGSAVT